MSRPLTTEEFVEEARRKHGDRYGYPHAIYKNSYTPIPIECYKHGTFYQRPDNHLAGKNCKLCAIEQQAAEAALTTEEYVSRARKKHGNIFDYANTVYKNCHTPVTMLCRIHNVFFSQNPYDHLLGKHGCTFCKTNYHPTNEEIILRFRAIHTEYGHNYEYDLSTLRNNKQTLYINCRLHGLFSVSYHRHLKGTGCPECTNHFHSVAAKYFVQRARAIHGKKYAYGTYFGAARKMSNRCPVHGVFRQTPASHLQGHGCPGCANDRKRLLAKGGYSLEFFVLHPEMAQRPGTLYIIEFSREGETFIKVGITRTSITSRFKGGYRKYARRLLASRSLCLYDAFCLEQRLLVAFKHCQIFPKQHHFVGKTECLLSTCVGQVKSWLEEHEAKPSSSIPSA